MDEEIKRIWYKKINKIPSAIHQGVEFFSLVELAKELNLNRKIFQTRGLLASKLLINGRVHLAAPMLKIAEVLEGLKKNWGTIKIEKRKTVISFLEFISNEMSDWLKWKAQNSSQESVPSPVSETAEEQTSSTFEPKGLCTESAIEESLSHHKMTVQTDLEGTEHYILKSIDESGDANSTPPRKKKSSQEASLLGLVDLLHDLASGKKLVVTIQIR